MSCAIQILLLTYLLTASQTSTRTITGAPLFGTLPDAVNYVLLAEFLNFSGYNMSNYGRRAFCFAGPYVWNSLPEHIRQSTSIAVFKRSVKTFLFQQISYPAPSTLETIVFYCFMGYISALANYLLLLLLPADFLLWH